jgi:predicted TIM-barrel enzyme
MEATGLGYDKEVEMIHIAHEMDLFTSPYVFNTDEAAEMVKAGADLIVCHVGLTTAGSIGAAIAYDLDQAVNTVMTIADAIWKLKQDALVICHGGPFDEPQNVGAALAKMPGIAGFYGASSAERLPTERAIKAQIESFKALKLG